LSSCGASLDYCRSVKRRYGHDWNFNWLARRRPRDAFGLCVVVTAAAWPPDLLPPAR
jgi:hypothetical protein